MAPLHPTAGAFHPHTHGNPLLEEHRITASKFHLCLKALKEDSETVSWPFGSVGKNAPFPLPGVTADYKHIQESHVPGDKEKVETQFLLQMVTCFLQ